MSSVKDKLLYSVFPRRCKLCGEVVALDEELCEECLNTEQISGEICLKCGREKEKCTCKKEHFSAEYKGFCAPYYFEGSMYSAVYRLKDSGYKELAPEMAKRIAECVKRNFGDTEFDVVTFVPMTEKRTRERGYNQSELLAAELSKELCVPCEELLIKTRSTKAQRLSGSAERKTNLYGAFEVKNVATVDNRTVLLVDDVKTTGATLNECAKTLKIYGASAVYACAFTVTNNKKKT